MSTKIKIATKSDIPVGSARVVQAGDKELAVFNVDGEFCAVSNECPHMGGPIGEGELVDSIVVCPWHGWGFDVKTGENPRNPNAKLPCFAVIEEGEDLHVEV